MGITNPLHILFIAAVALIVLGPKRLPDLAKSLGNGMREFREALSDAVHTDEQPVQTPALPAVEPVAAPEPVAPENGAVFADAAAAAPVAEPAAVVEPVAVAEPAAVAEPVAPVAPAASPQASEARD